MLKRTFVSLCVFAISCAFANQAYAQPTWTLDPFGREKKPKQFEDRKLGSEKTADKKFTVARQVIQNNITHYNYYFNANNKLNEVLETAKESFTDDYSLLLPFYNYTLDATARDSIKLDSITYKASTGIALPAASGSRRWTWRSGEPATCSAGSRAATSKPWASRCT